MHVYVCASEKARAGGAGGAQQHAARPSTHPQSSACQHPAEPPRAAPRRPVPLRWMHAILFVHARGGSRALMRTARPPGAQRAASLAALPVSATLAPSQRGWRALASLPRALGANRRYDTAPHRDDATHARFGFRRAPQPHVKAHSRATRKRICRDSRALPCIPADPAPSRASHATLPPQRVPTRTAWRASRPEGARGAQSTGEAPATASLSCILALPPDALGQQSRHSHACHILTGLPIARPETDPGRAPTWAAAPAPGRALPPPLWRPVRVAWSCAPRRGPWCCGSA